MPARPSAAPSRAYSFFSISLNRLRLVLLSVMAPVTAHFRNPGWCISSPDVTNIRIFFTFFNPHQEEWPFRFGNPNGCLMSTATGNGKGMILGFADLSYHPGGHRLM